MKNKGFSVLEMSIILVIAGILFTTIAGTNIVINSSRITKAITLTSTSGIHDMEGLILWVETSNMTKDYPDATIFNQWKDMGPYNMKILTNSGNTQFKKSKDIRAIKGMYFDGGTSYFRVVDTFPTLSNYTAFVFFVRESSAGYLIEQNNKQLNIPTSYAEKMLVLRYDGGIDKTIKIDKSPNFLSIDVISGPNPPTPDQFLHIGYGMTGFIYEIIIFNRDLSDQEIFKIEDYLYNKYLK